MMKREKVPSNLIINDLLQYNPSICKDNKSKKTAKKYKELKVIETDDGIAEKLVEVDYPITPEYVASFEQSANYKNDVDGAIAGAVNGANLGDITEYQKVLTMDTALISALADRLKIANAKINEINSKNGSSAVEPKKDEPKKDIKEEDKK